jgi:hypothetical protein
VSEGDFNGKLLISFDFTHLPRHASLRIPEQGVIGLKEGKRRGELEFSI